METQYHISKLIAKYYLNTISKEEEKELRYWKNSNKANEKLLNRVLDEKNLSNTVEILRSIELFKELDVNHQKISEKYIKRINYFKWTSYAAAILLLFVGITYLIYELSGNSQEYLINQLSENYKPGMNKSLLIDESGKTIALNKELSIISGDSSLSIQNISNALKYTSTKANSKLEGIRMKDVYHTLIIPTGGEHFLELSDGTKIWLNSESKIKYPKFMYGKSRMIELEGEAYFEVAENKNKPFFVKTKGVNIKVLGTAFNVSAYHNEDHITTTLVDGKVSISSYNDQMTLEPGYQSVYRKDKFEKLKVDTEYFTEWKNGTFRFKRINLFELTNKLSRWYGVQFFFDKEELKNIKFTGAVQKNKPLGNILKTLKETKHIKYKVSGNSVLIMK